MALDTVSDAMSIPLANRCRTLSDYHGGTDLAERVRTALEIQREQRVLLAQAADRIEELERELATAKAETRPVAGP